MESDELDYKSAMNWSLLPRSGKLKLLRHCTALANTRGGFLVIGVGEDASGHPSVLQGLTPEETHSFDPSSVGSFFTQYVEPELDFTIERPRIDGKRYAIFVVRPFATLPHVCTRDGEGELRQGVFYIRTAEAASRPAMRAFELHALMLRALRKQREELANLLRGILDENHLIPPQEENSSGRYDDECADAVNYFEHRKKLPLCQDVVSLTIRPDLDYIEGRFTLTELRHAAEKSTGAETYAFLAPEELASVYFANASLRMLAPDRTKLVLFTRSGIVLFLAGLDGGGARETLFRLLRSAGRFAENFYRELAFRNEELSIRLAAGPRVLSTTAPAQHAGHAISELLAAGK